MKLGWRKYGSGRAGRRPQALPATLGRKDTYIFPSRHGLLFIAVLFGMLVGSVNYNNNLGFLLCFLLGSVAFISIFHTSRNLEGLKIVSLAAEPVFAGEKAVFEAKVLSPSPTRPVVSWKFAEGGGETTLDLAADCENGVRVSAAAPRRGMLKPGNLTVETFYPLGLFRSWFHIGNDAGCLVYPRPEPVPFSLIGLRDGSEEDEENKDSSVDDFQGLRNYQPGDSMKHISWKIYSRGQGLYTKVFEEPAGAGVYLDYDALKEPDPEKRLSQLCFLVLKAHGMNMDYGLHLPGKTVEPDRGEAHKRNCLKALALFGLKENA